MDMPAVCKRNGLFAVQLETEKGSDLIEGAAETRGGGGGFEPACGPVALLDAPMVLLDGWTQAVRMASGRGIASRLVVAGSDCEHCRTWNSLRTLI